MTWTLRVLRKLLRVPDRQIGREEAVRLAQAEAVRRGVRVGETVAHEKLKSWIVWIDRDTKGSPWAEIDSQTGKVVKWASLPR